MLQLPFELLNGGSYRCTPAWRCDEPMVEEHHRVYFPRRGRAWIARDEHHVELRPRQIVLIPGYGAVRYGCDDQLDLTWLHFRAADVETEMKLARLARPVVWPARRWASWQGVYRSLQEVFDRPAAPPLPQQVQAMLLCMVAELLPQMDLQGSAEAARDLRRLRPAIAYMDAHFRDDPPLAEVAAQVHLSPTHFHRRFRRAMRISPRRYMLGRRMDLARRLLLRGDQTVTEAAEATGYNSVFHFSRVFRQFHGYPPTTLLRGKAPLVP